MGDMPTGLVKGAKLDPIWWHEVAKWEALHEEMWELDGYA